MSTVTDIIQQCEEVKRQLRVLKKQNQDKFYQLYVLKMGKKGFYPFSNPNMSVRRIMEALNKNNLDVYHLLSMLQNPNVSLELADYIIREKISPRDQHGCHNPYFELSYNPNLTQDYILKHIDERWSWSSIVYRTNISVDFIVKYGTADMIENNPNITLEDIDKYKLKCWSVISRNDAMTMEIITSNLDRPWDWKSVMFNPNLTPEYMKLHPELPWHEGYKHVCRSRFKPFPSMDEIENNKLRYFDLSNHDNLSLDFILQHPDKQWRLEFITRHKFDGGEIRHMTHTLKQLRVKLVKLFYWNLVDIMHKPYLGYYYLNDIELFLPEDKSILLQQFRKNKQYDQIHKLLTQ